MYIYARTDILLHVFIYTSMCVYRERLRQKQASTEKEME